MLHLFSFFIQVKRWHFLTILLVKREANHVIRRNRNPESILVPFRSL
jgi:hypothetical protein